MHDAEPPILTFVTPQAISTDTTFRHRTGPDSETHLMELRKILRGSGRLDPILVWKETKDGSPTGRLVLLDGHYRVAAYRAELDAGRISREGIPAKMLTGDRLQADLAALAANAKVSLPLTAQERTNAALSLVRTYRKALSIARLSRASGVSARTIARMREQLRKFDEAHAAPDGNWIIDRRFPEESDWKPPTDAAREHLVSTLSAGFQDTLRQARTTDIEIVADAIQRAVGQRQCQLIMDYLYGDEETTAWMAPDEFATEPKGENLDNAFERPSGEALTRH